MSNYYIAGHGLIINSKGQILVLKRSQNNDFLPSRWDIPGGTLEARETIEDTVSREVFEETHTRVNVHAPVLLRNCISESPFRQTIQAIYFCTLSSPNQKIILNNQEHSEYRWLAFEQIRKIETIELVNYFVTNFSVDVKQLTSGFEYTVFDNKETFKYTFVSKSE